MFNNNIALSLYLYDDSNYNDIIVGLKNAR